MLGVKFILAAALCQAQSADPNQDPAALVVQLGSARYANREAAAEALERIGRPALPALRSARDSHDPEVRIRAGMVAQKIESALLTQPTQLRLDFRDRPLPEVVRSLSLQTGFRIELYPSHLPKWAHQRITLNQSGPVDFWRAIDQLCDQTGLQYNESMRGYVGQSELIFALTDAMSRTLTPISDYGPFRVSLLSIDYQRHLSYAPGAPSGNVPPPPRPITQQPARPEKPSARLNPVTTVQFMAHLRVAAEPRLVLGQLRRLELVEAVDDRGNSLIPLDATDTLQNRHAGYFGMMTGPVVQLQAPLHRPEAAGQVIKKLRGVIPLTVSSRRPGPLVIPLNNAAGKTFENQDHRLTVHSIHATPNNHNILVELSITANDADVYGEQGRADAFNDGFPRADPHHLQIEVTDLAGHLVPWFQSATDSGPETSRFTLTLTNQMQTSRLKELRYYTLTRASVKVPFEFVDIPMP